MTASHRALDEARKSQGKRETMMRVTSLGYKRMLLYHLETDEVKHLYAGLQAHDDNEVLEAVDEGLAILKDAKNGELHVQDRDDAPTEEELDDKINQLYTVKALVNSS